MRKYLLLEANPIAYVVPNYNNVLETYYYHYGLQEKLILNKN